ncbi:hypothetical protein J5N97_018813 [Dioscorea zingiberensis]|uniref:Uncharacterized protein n=1 Tax=Dioscorea zingiberensis TaxID=325984 RepID=A0A9D5CDC0_9LILI|nr:hypothetical protein J5N97_018813 [Dioscorea zingiberensis]
MNNCRQLCKGCKAHKFGVSSGLQDALLQAGLLWYLLRLLLQYDSTGEENDMNEAHGVGARVQIAKNLYAVWAAHALSRLFGFSDDRISRPHNHAAANALKRIAYSKAC